MSKEFNNILNFVAYADGKRNLDELSNILRLPYSKVFKIFKLLYKNKIIT